MDLLYLTEVQAYQSIRGPVYDKYAWDQQDKVGEPKKQTVSKKSKKEPCKICQERKRRSLMTYIRSKSHKHSDQGIKEEEEGEEDEENKDAQAKQDKIGDTPSKN